MNTDIAITQETPQVHTLDFNSDTKPIHRKIAKLPKPLRDLINTCLDDNLPARQIIDKLQASTNPPLPYPISEVNISDWRKTGYQRYLAHQDHLDSIEASREAALEMIRTSNNLSLPQATLQVIASQCFEILAEFSPAAVKQKLAEDPLKYTSFLHVFARLTREMVHLEKFIEARAAAQAQKSDPNRDKEAEAAQFWTRHTKNLFNRKDPRRAKIENPEAIPLQSPVEPNDNPKEIALQSPAVPSDNPKEIALQSPAVPSDNPKEIALQSPVEPSDNPKGIALQSPGLRGTSYPGFETPNVHNPERVASSASDSMVRQTALAAPQSSVESAPSTPDTQPSCPPPSTNPSIHQSNNPSPPPEHCLDCHHPLPPLTPEGKRPFERCQVCNILLPPPGTCTRPSADKCHHCGATLPRRLPNGRRPKPTCHNCGTHLGRELDEDIQQFRDPNQPPM